MSLRGKRTIGVGFAISGEQGFSVKCCAISRSKNYTLKVEDMLAALESWGYRSILTIVDRGILSTRNIKIARGKNRFNVGKEPFMGNPA